MSADSYYSSREIGDYSTVDAATISTQYVALKKNSSYTSLSRRGLHRKARDSVSKQYRNGDDSNWYSSNSKTRDSVSKLYRNGDDSNWTSSNSYFTYSDRDYTISGINRYREKEYDDQSSNSSQYSDEESENYCNNDGREEKKQSIEALLNGLGTVGPIGSSEDVAIDSKGSDMRSIDRLIRFLDIKNGRTKLTLAEQEKLMGIA